MPYSRIQLEKLLKQGIQFQNLKFINVMKYIIYSLQQVKRLCLYTSKSRPCCSDIAGFLDFDAFLDLSNVGNLIELDFLMKPDHFPEIPRLPESIREVFILNSHSLHPQSLNRLFSQFGEFWYQEYEILQPRQNPMNNFQRYELILPGSVIPNWFNHQSVGNSISFWIGRDFPTFVCCAVLEPKEQLCELYLHVYLKINGTIVGVTGPFLSEWVTDMTCNHLWFFNVSREFPGLNLYDQNHVEVVIEASSIDIVQAGIHVECICPLVERFGEFEAKRQHQDQDHSTETLPPTSIPAFPICSISNSDLELSDSYSMERTYNDFESLATGSYVDGCNLSLSPYTHGKKLSASSASGHCP
nr:hypothetical protein CFP56_29047 [Quercus suber]